MLPNVERIYETKRGLPLLYVGQPPEDKPILALENYDKWYTPYLVLPNGAVVEVEADAMSLVMDTYPDALWVDHLFSPRYLYRLANQLGAILDERSLEVAAGRWALERVPDIGEEFTEPEEEEVVQPEPVQEEQPVQPEAPVEQVVEEVGYDMPADPLPVFRPVQPEVPPVVVEETPQEEQPAETGADEPSEDTVLVDNPPDEAAEEGGFTPGENEEQPAEEVKEETKQPE